MNKHIKPTLILIFVFLMLGFHFSFIFAQDTDLSAPTASETATFFASPTETPTLTPSPTATESPSPTFIPSSEPAPEITEYIPATTLELIAETTVEVLPETSENPIIIASETSTETPTSTSSPTPIIMANFQGSATYQNRQPDNANILVQVYSSNHILLSTKITDAAGNYQIEAPLQEVFYLVLDAPLYRPYQLEVWPNETIPPLILMGGDLDDDACVGMADLLLLSANFGLNDSADITNDGSTDEHDLTILAGNIEETCDSPNPTETESETAIEITPTSLDLTAIATENYPSETPTVVASETAEN